MPAPVMWLTTARLSHHDETQSNGTFKNICEARIIGQWLKRLDFIAKTKVTTYRVGVISGYVGQRTELQRVVASLQHSISALSIECNTVDAFQGREVDICIYSVTRCNGQGVIGFLRDERRMNVALSRGRIGLLIVGDHLFCRSAKSPNPLRTVVEYIEKHPGDCLVAEAETNV
jgi:superfamily I DNA and/or RNA helicase